MAHNNYSQNQQNSSEYLNDLDSFYRQMFFDGKVSFHLLPVKLQHELHLEFINELDNVNDSRSIVYFHDQSNNGIEICLNHSHPSKCVEAVPVRELERMRLQNMC